MKRATLWAVYCGSIAAHALLGVAMAAVEPPPPIPPRPIEITMAEPEPPPPPPPPEPKEELPPEEEPELEAEAQEPPPPGPEPKPKAKPAPKPDANAKPAKGSNAPFFAGHFEGGTGPGGLAVPQADREVREEESVPRPVVQKHRDLSKKPKLGAQRTCGEPIVKPKPIEIPQPAYPEAARAAGLEGKVRLRVTVGVDGKPTQIAVLASLDPELDRAARKAMKDARFEPGTQCGKAVSTSVTISIKFSK